MTDLPHAISELIEKAEAFDSPKEDTYFRLIEALSENAHMRQQMRGPPAQKAPRVIPPGATTELASHRGEPPHPADDVLNIAIKLVRAQQRYRITQDDKYRTEMLGWCREMRHHFRLTRKEAVRLAHVLVHVGSMSLRQVLSMRVMLEGKPLEPPEPTPPKIRGSFQKVVMTKPDEYISLDRALRIVFRVKSRMTTGDIVRTMEGRGWAILPGLAHKKAYLRGVLKDDPEFRQCGPKGGHPVWRYTGS